MAISSTKKIELLKNGKHQITLTGSIETRQGNNGMFLMLSYKADEDRISRVHFINSDIDVTNLVNALQTALKSKEDDLMDLVPLAGEQDIKITIWIDNVEGSDGRVFDNWHFSSQSYQRATGGNVALDKESLIAVNV